jgi:hypothetical protein
MPPHLSLVDLGALGGLVVKLLDLPTLRERFSGRRKMNFYVVSKFSEKGEV